jgi:hypothetical protein
VRRPRLHLPRGAALAATLLGVGLVVAAAPAAAQEAGPAKGVVYSARRGPAEVRLVGLGQGSDGAELVLLDVKVECDGFLPQGRMVGVVEEDGRFEVEGIASQPGTTDIVTGEFDDIDGKVRSDGVRLEIDIEVEGEDNAGPTGRCEETQPWELEPRRNEGTRRIDGAVPTEARAIAASGDALYTLDDGEVTRVDPQSLRTTWRATVDPSARVIAAGGDAVWLLDPDTLELTRLDGRSGDLVTTIPLEPAARAAEIGTVLPEIAAGPDAAWVAVDEASNLYRVDAATNTVEAFPMPGDVTALASRPGGVDVSLASEGEATTPFSSVPDGVTIVLSPAEALAATGERSWARDAATVTTLRREASSAVVPLGDLRVGSSPVEGASIVAASPGAWTTTARGLALVSTEGTRAGNVPIVGSAATGLAAVGDAVFVLDAGYLFQLIAR